MITGYLKKGILYKDDSDSDSDLQKKRTPEKVGSIPKFIV